MEVIGILLIGLFGLTAFDKAIRFERFYSELGKSPFLMNYAFITAIGTPLVELAVAVVLSIDKTRLKGLYASVFLMSLFTAYIYMLVNFSYFTSCLCSAAIESLSWQQHLIFNIVFLVLAIIGVLIEETNPQNQIPKS
ncbi:MauE/DoxX family redox-associated membrane protein [Olivibacter sp. 47]|uniref:MauE/DoxX family redox-associated membrane protein n=1 Tax=Olivibacter sp. 47 TaxID=3056486 RepID=UPI00338F081E